MPQAIMTKYFGPGNRRGSRIKATAAAGSVTVEYDHALSLDRNHATAAKALIEKFAWFGDWYGGTIADGRYVFVCADTHLTIRPEGKAV